MANDHIASWLQVKDRVFLEVCYVYTTHSSKTIHQQGPIVSYEEEGVQQLSKRRHCPKNHALASSCRWAAGHSLISISRHTPTAIAQTHLDTGFHDNDDAF